MVKVKKYKASGIYVNGSIERKEGMNIKDILKQSYLAGFKASESRLEKWENSLGKRR